MLPNEINQCDSNETTTINVSVKGIKKKKKNHNLCDMQKKKEHTTSSWCSPKDAYLNPVMRKLSCELRLGHLPNSWPEVLKINSSAQVWEEWKPSEWES